MKRDQSHLAAINRIYMYIKSITEVLDTTCYIRKRFICYNGNGMREGNGGEGGRGRGAEEQRDGGQHRLMAEAARGRVCQYRMIYGTGSRGDIHSRLMHFSKSRWNGTRENALFHWGLSVRRKPLTMEHCIYIIDGVWFMDYKTAFTNQFIWARSLDGNKFAAISRTRLDRHLCSL